MTKTMTVGLLAAMSAGVALAFWHPERTAEILESISQPTAAGFRQGVALACDVYSDFREWRGLAPANCKNYTGHITNG